MTLEEAKKILGKYYASLPDEKIQKTIDTMRILADTCIDRIDLEKQEKNEKSHNSS